MKLEERTAHRWGRRIIFGLAALLAAGTARLLLLPEPSVPALAGPPQLRGTTVVIDAGHGGEDGGAVSPAGTVESGINMWVVADNIRKGAATNAVQIAQLLTQRGDCKR